MSSASSLLPSDLVSVEVAAQQVRARPQTSLTRCTFPVLYPVPAPERGPDGKPTPNAETWEPRSADLVDQAAIPGRSSATHPGPPILTAAASLVPFRGEEGGPDGAWQSPK